MLSLKSENNSDIHNTGFLSLKSENNSEKDSNFNTELNQNAQFTLENIDSLIQIKTDLIHLFEKHIYKSKSKSKLNYSFNANLDEMYTEQTKPKIKSVSSDKDINLNHINLNDINLNDINLNKNTNIHSSIKSQKTRSHSDSSNKCSDIDSNMANKKLLKSGSPNTVSKITVDKIK